MKSPATHPTVPRCGPSRIRTSQVSTPPNRTTGVPESTMKTCPATSIPVTPCMSCAEENFKNSSYSSLETATGTLLLSAVCSTQRAGCDVAGVVSADFGRDLASSASCCSRSRRRISDARCFSSSRAIIACRYPSGSACAHTLSFSTSQYANHAIHTSMATKMLDRQITTPGAMRDELFTVTSLVSATKYPNLGYYARCGTVSHHAALNPLCSRQAALRPTDTGPTQC